MTVGNRRAFDLLARSPSSVRLSDRTLADVLAARLRAAGLFELFIRELAPREWYASARGFLVDGRMFKATARDTVPGRLLVALLAEADLARAVPMSAPMPTPARARAAKAEAPARPRRPRFERVAVELAERLDGFTLHTFAGALGYTFQETELNGLMRAGADVARERLAGVLTELVARGELRQEGPVYRRAPVAATSITEVSDVAV
jgi:hypothetical protein